MSALLVDRRQNFLALSGGGADIGPLNEHAFSGCRSTRSANVYFDWHHTEADTLDKVDPVKLNLHVAALAVMTYVVADIGPAVAVRRSTQRPRRVATQSQA